MLDELLNIIIGFTPTLYTEKLDKEKITLEEFNNKESWELKGEYKSIVTPDETRLLFENNKIFLQVEFQIKNTTITAVNIITKIDKRIVYT